MRFFSCICSCDAVNTVAVAPEPEGAVERGRIDLNSRRVITTQQRRRSQEEKEREKKLRQQEIEQEFLFIFGY